MNTELNYSKIFTNKFIYNGDQEQSNLKQYAKKQIELIQDKDFSSVMKNPKTDKFVLTFQSKLDTGYSPAKVGESFKTYLEKRWEKETVEISIDTTHVLVVDLICDLTYPIRWSPSNKLKKDGSTSGSWVLACGKVSLTQSGNDSGSPSSDGSAKKKKKVDHKESPNSKIDSPTPVKKTIDVDAPKEVKQTIDVVAPKADVSKSEYPVDLQSEGKFAYDRLIKDFGKETAWVMYDESTLCEKNVCMKDFKESADYSVIKMFLTDAKGAPKELETRYWYLRNILVKCECDETDCIAHIREKVDGKHPISLCKWLKMYKKTHSSGLGSYKDRYGRPIDDLSESSSASDSDSD